MRTAQKGSEHPLLLLSSYSLPLVLHLFLEELVEQPPQLGLPGGGDQGLLGGDLLSQPLKVRAAANAGGDDDGRVVVRRVRGGGSNGRVVVRSLSLTRA
jgi:hypothetical protein